MKLFRFSKVGLAAAVALAPVAALADESEPLVASEPPVIETLDEVPATTDVRLLDTVRVIGAREDILRMSGSAAFLDTADIRNQNYDDIGRLLQKVPGVYVRGEDGYGLFPNISLRGVDAGRTSKVTTMEDGILSAPAPYSAPAAYFTPTTGRMSAVEVLKGSSQIKYGPHTTGGVINYISTPLPHEQTGFLRATYGSDNDVTVFGYYGDVFDTSAGRFGFLIENWFRRTDGFKTLDGGGDTGFTKYEPMLKLFWEPDSSMYQRFEFKLGYTNLNADETYLGLSEEDFRANPFRRYAASRFDNIKTEHWRGYLRHVIEPDPDLRITTTAYYSHFKRNWFKIRRVNDGERNVGLAEALAADGRALQVLKGNAAGALDYRNNNRSYYLAGIESFMDWSTVTGPLDHDITFGMRYHQDRVRRFQRDEVFSQDSSGNITGSSLGPAGGGGNREQKARAFALYAQDRISIGRFSITPGFRFEHINYEYTDFNTTGNPGRVEGSGTSSINLFAPGVGLNFDYSDELSFFAGVFRGFSPPGPRDNARNGVTAETSTSYEIGVRYDNPKGYGAELLFFYTDFNNLLVPDNIGAGGGGRSENVGDVTSYGVELGAGVDAGTVFDWGFRTPTRLAFTYTRARLDGPSSSLDPESIFSGGRDGNKVPYVPTYQIHLGTGIEYERVGVYVDAYYQPSTFTTASNTTQQVDPLGRPDSRFGTTDAFFTLDFSVRYEINDYARLIGGVKNILDREYVAARHPEGPRPGLPRQFYVGVEMEF